MLVIDLEGDTESSLTDFAPDQFDRHADVRVLDGDSYYARLI